MLIITAKTTDQGKLICRAFDTRTGFEYLFGEDADHGPSLIITAIVGGQFTLRDGEAREFWQQLRRRKENGPLMEIYYRRIMQDWEEQSGVESDQQRAAKAVALLWCAEEDVNG